ncbi:MAG: iron-containing alcohol dehydrogenase, partial [Thermodesulfobacteriota bacterium]
MLNPYRIIQHHNPGRLLFGLEAIKKLPQEIPAGLKPLIVTDPGLAKAGVLKQLTDLLDQAGRPHAVFDRTVPDPSYECVAEAAEIYRSAGCSALIALGGGSSMDAAKAVGVSVNNPGQLADYLKKPYSPLPFFV